MLSKLKYITHIQTGQSETLLMLKEIHLKHIHANETCLYINKTIK